MNKQKANEFLLQSAVRRARIGIRDPKTIIVYKCSMCGHQYHTFEGEESIENEKCDCWEINNYKGNIMNGVIQKLGTYYDYGTIADQVANKVSEFTKRLYLDVDGKVQVRETDEL